MNPVGGRQSSRNGRAHALGEEPKISEETDGAKAQGEEDDAFLSDEDLHDDEEAGLTAQDRRRKQRRKRRNTQLDNRIVKEKVTADDKKQADQTVLRRLLVNGTLILLWYLFSLGISLVSNQPLIQTAQPTRNEAQWLIVARKDKRHFCSSAHESHQALF